MADTITGKLLQEQRTKIDNVIDQNNLSKTNRTLLEGQRLIIKFIEEDHYKVTDMYKDFQTGVAEKKKSLSQMDAIKLVLISSVISTVVSAAVGWLGRL